MRLLTFGLLGSSELRSRLGPALAQLQFLTDQVPLAPAWRSRVLIADSIVLEIVHVQGP